MASGGTRKVERGAGVAVTCEAIERYLDRLRAAKVAGLDVREGVLAAQKTSALDAAEKKLGAPFPADVRAFLRRGLRYPEGGTQEEPVGFLGFDFIDAGKVVKSTAILRQVANEVVEDPNDPHAALARRGVALSWSEPQLLVTGDGVYHFSYRNPILRVASSWSELLAHWLACGCFSSHSFVSLWKKVKPFVESDAPPSRNAWVKAYKKQFPKL